MWDLDCRWSAEASETIKALQTGSKTHAKDKSESPRGLGGLSGNMISRLVMERLAPQKSQDSRGSENGPVQERAGLFCAFIILMFMEKMQIIQTVGGAVFALLGAAALLKGYVIMGSIAIAAGAFVIYLNTLKKD